MILYGALNGTISVQKSSIFIHRNIINTFKIVTSQKQITNAWLLLKRLVKVNCSSSDLPGSTD
jgi:hypothetical protein